MPWFKRSPGEEPTESSAGEPATAERPVLEPLTDAEVTWLRTTISELWEQDVRAGDIDDLGRHYDELLTAWLRLRVADRPDPHGIINQIGLAFGQYVADHAHLEWKVATDSHGTEIALHRSRGEVLVYPTNLVARRWVAEETRALPALARATIVAVEQIP
jgi:hypothetical protein